MTNIINTTVAGLRGPGLTPDQDQKVDLAIQSAAAVSARMKDRGAPSPIGLADVALAVASDGAMLPVMLADGRHIGASSIDGNIRPLSAIGEQVYDEVDWFPGYIDGEAAVKIEVDAAGARIIGASSAAGLNYTATGSVLESEAPAPQALTQSQIDASWGYKQRLVIPASIADKLLIYLLSGQSNALGQNASNDAVIGAASIYPDNALMFEGGPWLATPRIGAVVPLVERDRGDQSTTKASSVVNHLIRDIEAIAGVRPRVLAIDCAEGGQPLMNLGPGSPVANRLEAATRAACAYARANGLEPVIIALDWVQGESDDVGSNQSPYSDLGPDFARRVGEVRTFARRMTRRLMAITGQIEEPLFLMQQVYSTAIADPQYQYRHIINESYRRLHGVENLWLSGPCYIGPPTGIAGDIHLNSEGQNRMGQQTARALLTGFFGSGALPTTIARAYFAAPDKVRVELAAQRYPIVIDKSGDVVATTGYLVSCGFHAATLDNEAIAITGVALAAGSDRVLEITLAAGQTGAIQLAYAHCPRESATWGPQTGAAGLIRDSTVHANIYTGASQANWLAAFNIIVEK